MHRPQWPKLFACTIRWTARLTSHPTAVAIDSYALAITCVFHGAPVHRSSFPLLVLVLPSIHPPTQDFFSRSAQADPSLMRRERLNRHLNRSSPVRLQRVILGATGSLGESLICIQTRASLLLSLAQDSGNSVRCSECRLILYSKWYAVGQACQSLYNV